MSCMPIPFVKAIDFSKNTPVSKVCFVSSFDFWVLSFFTGNCRYFHTELSIVWSTTKQLISPPAPFSFYLKNNSLEVLQGKPFTVFFQTVGSVHPEEAKIVFNNQAYFLSKNNKNNFEYTFPEVQEETSFFVTSTEFNHKPLHFLW